MNKIKKFLEHFFLIDDSPHKVAAGAALGIFLGIIPGEGVTAALILATIFRLNKLSAAAGALSTNMWGTLAILPPASIIGGFIFNTNPKELIESFHNTYDLGFKFFLSKAIFFDLVFPLATGFIISAAAVALLFYFAIYFTLKYKKLKFK
ncbi:MAG TPA: DUF2062 domain-containing protein [Candidatus Moranbacteria bacterium]|nr:DUF2062 domain-containing protein [Candidatus Moranbacteria bacterium]